MTVTIPSALDEAVARRALAAGYASPEEFLRDSVARLMAEDADHEAAVLEGLRAPVSPLTRDDFASVRDLIRQARERSGS